VVELYDEHGRWLLSAPCYSDKDTEDSDMPPYRTYRGWFRDYTELRVIKVVCDGAVVATFKRSAQAPIIEAFDMQEKRGNGKDLIRLKWKAVAEPNAAPLQCGVRFSKDGKRWRALAASLKTESLVVDLDTLPGGKTCRFQLVASAGFRTVTRELALAERGEKLRDVYILSPKDGAEFEAGAPIPLAGTGFSPDFGNCRQEELTWTFLGERSIGIGQQLTITDLPAGFHTITLHASDGMGGVATKSVGVRVLPRKRDRL
jgi:hypothetical protein